MGYELRTDSTVILRHGLNDDAMALNLRARDFMMISDRVAQRFYPDQHHGYRYLQLGYTDGSVYMGISQRFNVLFALGAGLIGLAFLGAFVGMGVKLKRARDRVARARLLRKGLAAGQDKEKQHLARELHDGPIQKLHGLHVELMANAYVDSREAGKQYGEDSARERLGQELMNVAKELRDICAHLHPSTLERFGLREALRAHADRMEAECGIPVDFEVVISEESTTLTPSARLALYRIAQEAISNASRHSEASHITVRIEENVNGLHLRVMDDGKGFDADKQGEGITEQMGQSYGLLSMQERAELLGASFAIDSAPGAGTIVQVAVPASRKANQDARGIA
jgi:signal transduction histidine kinase